MRSATTAVLESYSTTTCWWVNHSFMQRTRYARVRTCCRDLTHYVFRMTGPELGIQRPYSLLVADRKYRLRAKHGIAQFAPRLFSNSMNWGRINSGRPPFLPEVKGPTDTQYFEDQNGPQPTGTPNNTAGPVRTSDINDPGTEEFIGFTCNRYSYSTNEPPPGNKKYPSASILHNPAADCLHGTADALRAVQIAHTTESTGLTRRVMEDRQSEKN